MPIPLLNWSQSSSQSSSLSKALLTVLIKPPTPFSQPFHDSSHPYMRSRDDSVIVPAIDFLKPFKEPLYQLQIPPHPSHIPNNLLLRFLFNIAALCRTLLSSRNTRPKLYGIRTRFDSRLVRTYPPSTLSRKEDLHCQHPSPHPHILTPHKSPSTNLVYSPVSISA